MESVAISIDDDAEDYSPPLGQPSASLPVPIDLAPAATPTQQHHVIRIPPPDDGDSRLYSFDPHQRARKKPGKKPHPIWSFYEQFGEKKAHPDARCKFCKAVINNGKPSSNLKTHMLLECEKVSAFDQDQVRYMFQKRRATGTADVPPPSSLETEPREQTAPSKQPVLIDQAAFEIAFAQMVYVCALPLRFVESPSV